MRLAPFEYLAPESLNEALAAKANLGAKAVWLAGGTDLLPRAKQGLAQPQTVISLKHLCAELSAVSQDDGKLQIGALAVIADVANHPTVQGRLPGLSEALHAIGALTLQQRVGTLGGNLCADTRCLYYNQSQEWRAGLAPCFKLAGEVCHAGGEGVERCRSVNQSDGAVMLSALDARVLLAGEKGQRSLPLEDFFTGQGETPIAMEADELLLGVEVALPPDGSGSAYERLALRGAIDYPLASAAAAISLEDGAVSTVRVALGAVFAAPLLLKDAVAPLLGQAPDEAALAQAAQRAGRHAGPFLVDNVRADLQWRKEMAPVPMRRALERALARARGTS